MHNNSEPGYQRNSPPHNQQQNTGYNAYLTAMGYRENYSLKCHGKDFAIEIKPDATKSNWHTVRIEAAKRINGQQAYDWSSKISLQLTNIELPEVAAFFLTLTPSVLCNYHGSQNNKGFEGRFQKDSVFASLNESGKPKMGIKMSFADSMMFGHLCLSQYCFNFPHLTTDAAYNSFKLLGKRIGSSKS